MQYKYVTEEEMNLFIEKSRDQEHPYYYRFTYKTKMGYMATRIRKNQLNNIQERKAFHDVEIEANSVVPVSPSNKPPHRKQSAI